MREYTKQIAVGLVTSALFVGIAAVVGQQIPLWAAALIAAAIGAITFVWGRATGPQPVELAYLTGQVWLHLNYSTHLYDALESLRAALEGRVVIDRNDFIERGLLGPARDYLTSAPDEHIRTAVFVPEGQGGKDLAIAVGAGYSLEGQQKLRLPIADSFAGAVFTSGEGRWHNDVATDPYFRPRAEAKRPPGSMVALPVWVRTDVVGVFVVSSTYEGAWTPADLTYLTLLTAIISAAWEALSP